MSFIHGVLNRESKLPDTLEYGVADATVALSHSKLVYHTSYSEVHNEMIRLVRVCKWPSGHLQTRTRPGTEKTCNRQYNFVHPEQPNPIVGHIPSFPRLGTPMHGIWHTINRVWWEVSRCAESLYIGISCKHFQSSGVRSLSGVCQLNDRRAR